MMNRRQRRQASKQIPAQAPAQAPSQTAAQTSVHTADRTATVRPVNLVDRATTELPDGWLDYDRIPTDLAESVRGIVDRHRLRSKSSLPNTIAVTSTRRGEGVTTVSQALATIVAEDYGRSVCWVDFGSPIASDDDTQDGDNDGSGDDDGDMTSDDRRGGDGGSGRDGGSGVIEMSSDQTRTAGPGRGSGDASRLVALPARPMLNAGRHRLARSPEFEELLDNVADEFDHVILDVPPIRDHAGALALLRLADTAVLVVGHRRASINEVRDAIDAMAPTPNLAVVINRFEPLTPRPIRRLMDR